LGGTFLAVGTTPALCRSSAAQSPRRQTPLCGATPLSISADINAAKPAFP
jgi:hypothetical protein